MHIKRVELSHFKSFGGTTQVPLLPGFTVISGPNGSGKSNILDALLFGLGLASSKGMRADRLPDLVNQNQMSRRATSEASVTVTFDLSDVAADLMIDGDGEAMAQGNDANGNGALAKPPFQGIASTNGHNGSSPTLEISESDDAANVVTLPTGREWSVTRRLRVTSQGTYTSNYYINGEPCTLNQLHEQLQRFHVYPEGYNVVLQGDVTSIISMNSRERREIIDELAGVAAFDRKIDQARGKLEAVRDHEERFRIVERELQAQLERLAQDRQKAEKYQRLKETFQTKSQWEAVLLWQSQQRAIAALHQTLERGEAKSTQLAEAIAAGQGAIAALDAELAALNARIRAMGEDEHLALQAQVATHEAELRQLQRQEQESRNATNQAAAQRRDTEIARQQQQRDLEQIGQSIASLTTGELVALTEAKNQVQQALEERRQATLAIASESQTSIQQQTQLRQAIDHLRGDIEPQRAEQIRLQERLRQLEQQIEALTEQRRTLGSEPAESEADAGLAQRLAAAETEIQNTAAKIAAAEAELSVQRDTQTRLLKEQRDKQRELDKLEAQTQALQESQGTHATKLLLDSGLAGISGLVAQLGKVDPKYQLALEIAAGARLSYLVVENDQVAAKGIEFLKQRRAGRATFLPLNKIRAPRFTPVPDWKRPDGFLDYAVNLIDCDPRYRDIFGYTFGSTVVFDSLTSARQHLGDYRIVTLEGEILETSGAMTGGNVSSRSGSLHFGTVEPAESTEAQTLRQRLGDIEVMLERCDRDLNATSETLQTLSQSLIAQRQQYRELQMAGEQQQSQQQQQAQQRAQLEAQLTQHQQELTSTQARLQELAQSLPVQEAEIARQQQALSELEQSVAHSEWQTAQAAVGQLESELGNRQQALQDAERHLQELHNQRQQLELALTQAQQTLTALAQQQSDRDQQFTQIQQQQAALNHEIAQLRQQMAALDQTLAAEKAVRDDLEQRLRAQRTQTQQQEWERQKLLETQQERRQQLAEAQELLAAQAAELPEPLPEIPAETDLEELRKELRSLQRRMEAMEPVNMLALEEYNRTEERLTELTHKLTTLEEERTELLLRIETFTTLRRQAFTEAYDAVNLNFQSIFAELSDGDGHLQLEDPEDPFNGGLNLVAHPKGKPVRRLASMSGGEKSLTALSFIFALQRYRPSPFYAFDEVDMFLDGANVERLSRMIKHQTEQAQFIVVSLRRPMIEAAQRTIGVTQARGAYTQVLGIDLETQSATL
ncbi:chromosome segregation protein SMC [Leptolyngbya sp. CCNP1308]|uniref:chromosome segregation protein SMC n=1 Tax=Leptolyngbya sp. CCNP1308 TaxID=3110255 RepID=UPI002B218688|nr:chromosome segregation protein SMC [Leptolyngbya sp. CCNP1308]MEA5451546.1 chromosome segregation protein SMC [Leptolyngbya sp. CCNP1308]